MRSTSRLFAGLLWLVLTHAALAAESGVKILERAPVEYPPAARRAGQEGIVTVAVEVAPDGSVAEARVAKSSGSPLLDEAGVESVRGWRFQPMKDKRGRPVVIRGAVTVEFKLTDPVKPATPGHEYVLDSEEGRLAAIWLTYRNYQGFAAEVLQKCDELGMDTKPAREANRKFNAEADAKFVTLEQRLKALLAKQGDDPAPRFNQVGQELDADIKRRAAELFEKGEETPRQNCEMFIEHWGSLEGSFRFTDYYERLMAL
jgi:TonB family protein